MFKPQMALAELNNVQDAVFGQRWTFCPEIVIEMCEIGFEEFMLNWVELKKGVSKIILAI